ncbi:hypothetical protein D3C72_693240 [compost metagenome]
MGLPVVLITLAIQLERQFGDLLIGEVGIARIEHFTSGRFLGASSGSLLQALLDGVQLRVVVAIATHPARVEHAHGRHRLESLVGLRGGQRVATATADAEQAQTLAVDASILGDEVRHAVDILDAVRRLVDAARLSATCALIRGIGGNRDVALFGQSLGIQTGDLLFHAAIGVRHHHRRVGLLRIVVGRGVDVGSDVQAIELVADRMDVDLAGFILGNCTVVSQGERVLFVVGGAGFASRNTDHGGHQRGFQNCVSHKCLRSIKRRVKKMC